MTAYNMYGSLFMLNASMPSLLRYSLLSLLTFQFSIWTVLLYYATFLNVYLKISQIQFIVAITAIGAICDVILTTLFFVFTNYFCNY